MDSEKACNLNGNYSTKKAFPLNPSEDNGILPVLTEEKERKMVFLFRTGSREILILPPDRQPSIYRRLIKSTPIHVPLICHITEMEKKSMVHMSSKCLPMPDAPLVMKHYLGKASLF